MLISRTPFRISFSGGSSDLREYYKHGYGAVVSTTIDKYVFLSMHPLFNDNGYHLKYFDNEVIPENGKIKHPIIREVFNRYKISGVDFNSSSDIPSGTGLGSSSSFTSGLINLCSSYRNIFHPKEDIAKEASHIEIDILKAPIGKQDQYASAVGGLNFIQFNPDESVVVEKIYLSEEKRLQLERSLMLFYVGGTRSADSILNKTMFDSAKVRENIDKMVMLAEEMRNELKADRIDSFGEILDLGWQYKKELSPDISNGNVEYWYKKAMEHGAKGGKLLGAGGGGFLLLYVPEGQDILRASLRLYEMKFKFDNSGTTIIY